MSNSIFLKDGTAQGVAKQRLIETLAASNERIINDPMQKDLLKALASSNLWAIISTFG